MTLTLLKQRGGRATHRHDDFIFFIDSSVSTVWSLFFRVVAHAQTPTSDHSSLLTQTLLWRLFLIQFSFLVSTVAYFCVLLHACEK